MEPALEKQHPIGIQQRKWTVFSLVATAIFMSTLDSSIVNIALSSIMKDFSESLTTIQWVMMAYLLTVSSVLLGFGKLSDIKGRRYVYVRGFMLFTVSSLGCALAPAAGWLLGFRVLQALGAAMLMACSPALVVDAFPATERGRILGMVGMVVAAGLTSGPAIGGILLKFFQWRAIFLINIPIGLLATVRANRILKGTAGDMGRNESFDWRGAVLLAGCFCAFIIAVSFGGKWGPYSWQTLLASGLSLLCAVLAAWAEHKAAHPIFHLGLLRNRLFILPVVALLILFAALFSMVFLMPFYLLHPAGYSIERTGFMMIIPFAFLFFVSPLSGDLSDRIGSRLLCTFGMLVLSLALWALSVLEASAPALAIAWRLGLAGVGTALFISPNSATTMSAIGSGQRGVAAGTIATARNLGMVIGVALAGLIFTTVFHSLTGGGSLNAYGPSLQQPFMNAFRWAMRGGSILAGIGAVFAFMRGPEGHNRHTEAIHEQNLSP
jgi:EmrB/QacA subfamily drug resistance transporter